MRFVSNLAGAVGATAAALALSLGASAQTLGCEVGVANGGAIPASGTGGGGGTYPTGALPPNPSVFPLAVASVPGGATVVTEVKVFGMTHTWCGDTQIVLVDPFGGWHNVFVRPGTATGTDYSCDFGGDYVFVSPCAGGAIPLPASCTGAAIFTPGVYNQHFGRSTKTWTSGANGIFNTPLDSISANAGVWELRIYDWATGDGGGAVSWDICFGNPLPAPPPSSAPVLTAPADLATVTNPVTFTWNAVNCATSYDIDVDGVVTNVATNSFSGSYAPGLHTWTVRASTAGGPGPYAALRTFDVPPPPPPSVCVSGGGGGAVPATGTGGGGVFPGTLPPSPFVSSYLVNVPTGSTQLVKVELSWATEHTWSNDVQAVLTDPTGVSHNLICRVPSGGCDLNGTYSIYETAGLSWPTVCPASGDIPAGDYDQFFGTWPDGTNGIFNTPLSAIPVSSGLWTLTMYDWVSGDAGVLGSWSLCFDGVGGLPTFCVPQAPGSTNGCIPTIDATGNPDVAHSNATIITVSNVEGQRNGLLLYGVSGQINVPWCAGGNSFRCLQNPVQRMTLQLDTGGTAGNCDGSLVQDWNLYQLNHPAALGNPFLAGDTVDVQGWFRDPGACKDSFMSQGLRLTYQP